MSEKTSVVSSKRRNYYTIASIVFLVIGVLGTYASKPGIYLAFYAIGVSFLITALYEHSKISKK